MDDLYIKRLRGFRKSRNNRITQLEFSEELDITPEHYSNIENGGKNPSMLLHIDICLKLGKPSDCFFNQNHADMILTPEQQQHLLSMGKEKLRTILEILQVIYEHQKTC